VTGVGRGQSGIERWYKAGGEKLGVDSGNKVRHAERNCHLSVYRISYSSNQGGSQEHISLLTILLCF